MSGSSGTSGSGALGTQGSGATSPRGDAQGSGSSITSGSRGTAGMGGVTPGRAEQASSAFTKLDANNRGYVTMEDARQLDGFDTHFRQADRNNDGQLDESEFNSAWSAYGRGTR